MSIRQFKTLIAIAETGTFSAAARAVYLTPAAVSQQMKALEQELEVELFDRSRRPPELNPVGHALIPRARELVGIYENLLAAAGGEIDVTENLTIGTVPTTMSGMMPRALKGLQRDHENLHVRIYPGLSEDLYAQVDRGFLDAAVLTEPPTLLNHLHWRPIVEEPLVLLASKNTASENAREILETQPFIRFARKAWVGQQIEKWLSKNKIQVNERMELDTLEATSAMVINNLGVAIVPLNACAMPEQNKLKIIPLGDRSPRRTLGVICRRDTAKYKLVELLWQEMLRVTAEAENRVKY